MTHDHKRDRTTTLFAALDKATGEVSGRCYARHRHEEFVFLGLSTARSAMTSQVHVILYNSAPHKHDQLERLRSEPTLLSTAIAQMLRFEGPSKMEVRRVAEDLELRGKRLHAGEEPEVWHPIFMSRDTERSPISFDPVEPEEVPA